MLLIFEGYDLIKAIFECAINTGCPGGIYQPSKCSILAIPHTVPVSSVVTLHSVCPFFSLTAESKLFHSATS